MSSTNDDASAMTHSIEERETPSGHRLSPCPCRRTARATSDRPCRGPEIRADKETRIAGVRRLWTSSDGACGPPRGPPSADHRKPLRTLASALREFRLCRPLGIRISRFCGTPRLRPMLEDMVRNRKRGKGRRARACGKIACHRRFRPAYNRPNRGERDVRPRTRASADWVFATSANTRLDGKGPWLLGKRHRPRRAGRTAP